MKPAHSDNWPDGVPWMLHFPCPITLPSALQMLLGIISQTLVLKSISGGTQAKIIHHKLRIMTQAHEAQKLTTGRSIKSQPPISED